MNTQKAIAANNYKLLKKHYPLLWQFVQNASNSKKLSQSGKKNRESTTTRIDKSRTIFYGGNDPQEFVNRLMDNWRYEPYDILFLLGMGLGYLPVGAMKGNIGNPRIIVIEPSIQTFQDALECTDLSGLFINDRIGLFVGDDICMADIVAKYQEKIPAGRNQIFVHPNYDKIFGQTITSVKQELTERIRAIRDIWFTTKNHGRQMFNNTVANLPSLFSGGSMKNLREIFKDIPTICMAAGPSLDHALTDLKKLQHHALLIACDSAVNALLKAGIRPHIVVTTDIFETNIDKLKPHVDALIDTWFIYSIESNADNVRLYLGQKRVAVTAYSQLLLSFLDPSLDLQCELPSMTSVSHMAIFSALALGADPIVLVGMDLSYPKGKSHSFDSAFFHSLEHEKRVATYGNDGTMISSSPQFIADKLHIERIATQRRVRFINTCIKGAYIEGAEIRRLAEIVDGIVPSTTFDANAALDAGEWKPVADESTAVAIIEELIGQLKTFKDACGIEKKRLAHLIDRHENHSGEPPNQETVQQLEQAFEKFRQTQYRWVRFVNDVILADLHEILKKKELLSVCTDENEHGFMLDRLKLLVKQYDVYEMGVEFQIDGLKKFCRFANDRTAIKARRNDSEQEWDIHIQLARCFERAGELWQARREYEYCMSIRPEDIAPYMELICAFIGEKMWAAARELIGKARCVFDAAAELDQMAREVENGIDGILAEIKTEWLQGNMHTTRKLLNQYLILRPDDSQANELRRVIRELDEEFSAEWFENENKSKPMPDVQVRLKQAAERIQNLKFEQGIGVLEGIIEDFPGSQAVLREQIGDIRFAQKDYQGALWNFSKVLKIEPERSIIKNKIQKTKHVLG